MNRKRWLILAISLVLATGIALAVAIPITQNQAKATDFKAQSFTNTSETNAIPSTQVTSPNGQPTTDTSNTTIPSYQRFLLTPEIQTANHPPPYTTGVSIYANLTRFKTLKVSPNSRVFVMGDIHGSLREMNQLLQKINFEPTRDVLVLAGDLVSRGEDSPGVVTRAQELGAFCVRGNHDDKVIRLRNFYLERESFVIPDVESRISEGDIKDPMKVDNKHYGVARQLSPEQHAYLSACPLLLDMPDLNARVVHGGVDPGLSDWTDNDPWSVMNIRTIDQDGTPTKDKAEVGGKTWMQAYHESNQNTTIYYGHDASLGLQIRNKTKGLDSGCVHGRQLTAIEVRSQTLYQVDCEQADASDHDDDE
ncbi:Metallo-dependent phosphatase-like protein [Choanephora cucurbitarum]|nr:Metallo-dependent phosphatase-like protein [Choanephora cucurbitarum]